MKLLTDYSLKSYGYKFECVQTNDWCYIVAIT